MNVRTVQHSMLKRAGLFGNTMVGRWITDTMGPHTFVSDALGASALDMIDHQAKTQLGWRRAIPRKNSRRRPQRRRG